MIVRLLNLEFLTGQCFPRHRSSVCISLRNNRAEEHVRKRVHRLIHQERPRLEADRHIFSPPFGHPARRLVAEQWQVSWLTDHGQPVPTFPFLWEQWSTFKVNEPAAYRLQLREQPPTLRRSGHLTSA